MEIGKTRIPNALKNKKEPQRQTQFPFVVAIQHKIKGNPSLTFFIKISQKLCLKDPQYLMQK